MINTQDSNHSLLSKLGIDLEKLKSEPFLIRVHKRAVMNWLTKYSAKASSSNLEKIHGLLEALLSPL